MAAGPPRRATVMSNTVVKQAVSTWHTGAACRERPDLDFIDPEPDQAEQCRTVCAGCPVREQCLADALAAGEPWGIWGGLDPDERAALAERTDAPKPTVLPSHGTNSRYVKHGCRCTTCRHAHTTYERERRRRNKYRLRNRVSTADTCRTAHQAEN